MSSGRALRSVVAFVLAVSFAACGGSGDDDASEPVASVEPAAADDESEPAQSEPARSEPAQSEPAQSEPAQTEPIDPPVTEPAQSEPAQTEPIDPPVTEPAATEPGETVSFDRNAGFRDDFDGALLPGAGWTWIGEQPDRWGFEDGHLVITGGNPHFIAEPVNLLTRIVPDEMEFGISASVTGAPQENFEAIGITLLNEQGAYVAVLLGFCEFCVPDSGGVGIFGEAMRGEDNLLVEPAMFPYHSSDPVTLTLEWSQGNGVVVAGYIAAGDEYRTVFRLEDAPVFTAFGLFTHNLPMGGENTVDVEGRFDWFELTVYEP